MRVTYAIVFVSDMARSVVFYRDICGLPLRFETPQWTEFATEGATLALHAADPKCSGAPPKDEQAGTCRTGFSVADLGEFHARMLNQNVTCVQDPKDIFGVSIAQYLDPDGMQFGVSQQTA